MNTLSHELRAVIARRIEAASSREILTIASMLCADEERGTQDPTYEDRERAGREVDELPQPSMARFELIDAKQALDRSTNLIWTRQNVGDKRLTWAEAGETCAELDIGGSDSWRLPTIRELLSIVDYDRYDQAIDTDVFTCEAAWYWTSTPAARSPGDCAWGVFFDSGDAYWVDHDYDGFVRAVRPGQ
jgi:hypothetical protein